MNRCLLCLRTNLGFAEYIQFNSPQWFRLDILKKIERHLWTISNVDNVGICLLCWSKLNDFHTFYGLIAKAHSENVPISMEQNNLENSKYHINIPGIDIKLEETTNGEDSLLCETTATASIRHEVDLNTTSTQKRKRGRPRKKFIIKEKVFKKKRGRPRKQNLDNNDSHGITPFLNNSIISCVSIPQHDQQALQQPSLTIARMPSPQKVKRSRGRPRKLQLNKEGSNLLNGVNDLPKVSNEVLMDKQCLPIQIKEDLTDVSIKSNETDKLLHKKMKISFLKKRKRVQQHSALMRNYIATSMRCMKFLKND